MKFWANSEYFHVFLWIFENKKRSWEKKPNLWICSTVLHFLRFFMVFMSKKIYKIWIFLIFSAIFWDFLKFSDILWDFMRFYEILCNFGGFSWFWDPFWDPFWLPSAPQNTPGTLSGTFGTFRGLRGRFWSLRGRVFIFTDFHWFS